MKIVHWWEHNHVVLTAHENIKGASAAESSLGELRFHHDQWWWRRKGSETESGPFSTLKRAKTAALADVNGFELVP